jgi:hypothetical protein
MSFPMIDARAKTLFAVNQTVNFVSFVLSGRIRTFSGFIKIDPAASPRTMRP